MSPIREAVSHAIKIRICLASRLSRKTMKKGKSRAVNYMDHKAFISQLQVFDISNSVVDDGFHLPLTSSADPYFLRSHVVTPSKRLGLIISAQLQKFRWNQPRFGACF